jgi:hypothetical protein
MKQQQLKKTKHNHKDNLKINKINNKIKCQLDNVHKENLVMDKNQWVHQ